MASVRPALQKTFLSLRNRNFRLYFFGQLISNTGNWLTNVAITLLVLKLTGSGFDVGLLAACQFGPMLFLAPWAGAVADRSDKRRMLLLTQSLEMAQSVGLAVLAFMPHPPLVGLYILAAFGGIFLAFDNPLRRSFVSEMVPKEDISNAVVLYNTNVNLSRLFGPALAGLFIVTLGYGWSFTLDAASYLVVICCLYAMRQEELHREPPKAQSPRAVREGLRYVRSVPTLFINMVMLAAIGMLAYNFGVTFPLFIIHALNGTNASFTIFYSIFSFGAVVCSLIIAHRNLVSLEHGIAGAALLGVTMLLLAAAPGIIPATVLVFFVGMASMLYLNATTALVQLEGKREMHGRLLALQSMLIIGTSVFNGPLLGFVSDAFGGRMPIFVGGIASLAAAGYGFIASRRVVS